MPAVARRPGSLKEDGDVSVAAQDPDDLQRPSIRSVDHQLGVDRPHPQGLVREVALAVCFFTPGLSVADARDRGWLRIKRVSPTPLPITLAAKVAACIPYVAAVLGVMAVAAQLTGTLEVGATAVVRLIAVLLVGALPFALVSLAIGFRTSPNAGVAVMQALLFPMVIASGLWFPLEVLPAPVAAAAPYLPTYHLAQLALAQLSGAAVTTHVLALVAMAAMGGVAAIASYRTARL